MSTLVVIATGNIPYTYFIPSVHSCPRCHYWMDWWSVGGSALCDGLYVDRLPAWSPHTSLHRTMACHKATSYIPSTLHFLLGVHIPLCTGQWLVTKPHPLLHLLHTSLTNFLFSVHIPLCTEQWLITKPHPLLHLLHTSYSVSYTPLCTEQWLVTKPHPLLHLLHTSFTINQQPHIFLTRPNIQECRYFNFVWMLCYNDLYYM